MNGEKESTYNGGKPGDLLRLGEVGGLRVEASLQHNTAVTQHMRTQQRWSREGRGHATAGERSRRRGGR